MKLFLLILIAAHLALWLVQRHQAKPRNAEETMEQGFGTTVILIILIMADAVFLVTGLVRWLISE